MATKSEIAAFEDFKFQISEPVRLIGERILTQVAQHESKKAQSMIHLNIVVGLVWSRWLVQDEAGISRYYYIRGADFDGKFKEFELESVSAYL